MSLCVGCIDSHEPWLWFLTEWKPYTAMYSKKLLKLRETLYYLDN